MNQLREKLDPAHTLPTIQLRPVGGEEMDILNENGNVIGDCTIVTHEDKVRFGSLHIDEELRGKGLGYGLATYVTAIEVAHDKGLPFESDKTVYEGAKKIWEILVNAGVAEELEPFKEKTYEKDGKNHVYVIDGETVYTGRYQVPTPV